MMMAQASSSSLASKKRKAEEGEEESREKLPLESEELLSQLAVRQHESILEYRTQVSALRRQTSLLEKRVVETERREAVVAEAWASLNAALLLLRDQLSSPQSPVSELSRVVSSWICKPGSSPFGSKVTGEAESALDGGADDKSALRNGEAFTVVPDSKSEDDDGEEDEALHALFSSCVDSSGSAEKTDLSDLRRRLSGMRLWSGDLFAECLGLALSAVSPSSSDPPLNITLSSNDSPSSSPVRCARCLHGNAVIFGLRVRLGSWRARAKAAERQRDAKAKEASAAALEVSRLRKKILLLTEESAGNNSCAASLARLAADSTSIEELQTRTDSAFFPGQGNRQASSKECTAQRGESEVSREAISAASKSRRVMQAPSQDSGGPSLSMEEDTQAQEEVAALTARLAEKERRLVELEEHTAALQKVADEANALSSLRHLQVLRSPPFLELQKLCAERDAALAERSAEVDELRRELLAEQGRSDREFDAFVKSQEEARKQLADRATSLREQVETLKAQNEHLALQLQTARREVEASKRIQEEVEKTSAQRTLQLAHVRMQCDQLKEAGKLMLARNERLKKEKQQMIEALRSAEDARVKLSAGIRSDKSESLSSSCSSGDSHKLPSRKAESCITVSSKEAVADQQPEAAYDTATEAALLRNEVEALRRQLAERMEVESEVAELRLQYGVVSEELEEVSKAFEERQSHCEHLIRQLKARDDAAIQQKTETDTAQQQLQYLQRINRLQEQKLLLQKQHLDQVTANTRSFVDGVQVAVSRAGAADTQCSEISSCFQAMRVAREQLFKEKEELTREVQILQETRKATEASLERHQATVQTLRVDLRRQREARAEAERRLEKLREKHERKDKKKSYSDAEDSSRVAQSLLQEENENMRVGYVPLQQSPLVCNERFKDHMLLKCGHIFCKECIDKNVKARNRKCPHCKSQFDQRDIRKVYLHN